MTEPFLSTSTVREILAREPIRPWRVKEICDELGLSHEEKNLKDVSNRCGYIVTEGSAQRIAQGTYVLIEKGTAMTVTEIESSNGLAPPQAEFQCPECGAQLKSQMGLRTHITKSHKPGLNADEAFDRVSAATRILFPDPEDVYSRLEEIASLRKDMLKAITRR